MSCEHEGESRGFTQIQKLEEGWVVRAGVVGSDLPDTVFICEDLHEAMDGASIFLGNILLGQEEEMEALKEVTELYDLELDDEEEAA